MRNIPLLALIVGFIQVASSAPAQQGPPGDAINPAQIGHSAHGVAHDEGPRQRPWKMTGIGVTHFPITTSVPEVQEWFDQGHTLLHSYWAFEAERAFRWCLKLDPECAMAYWGLYRAASRPDDPELAREFLREAMKRKDRVTERERMYLEAWQYSVTNTIAVLYSPEQIEAHSGLRRGLEAIMMKYPDDIEAKALYLNECLWPYAPKPTSLLMNRPGNELIAQQILAVAPDHPGAHHYRIHTWDGPDGWMALDSCAAYGKIGTHVGHARHMPGHIYSSQGMWHEAAIAMDSATRVEKEYFSTQLEFPFTTGNYAHNLNYLAYFQEQLGRPDLAIEAGRQLIEAPLDPRYNDPDVQPYCCFREGMIATIRAAVRFERWDDILTPGFLPWRDTLVDRIWGAYSRSLAHLGRGDLAMAQDELDALKKLEAEAAQPENFFAGLQHPIQSREVEGRLLLARGDTLAGLELLSEAARLELELRADHNDPPSYPRVVYNVLGEAYLELGSPRLAVAAFEETLGTVFNDPIALAGLVRGHAALGEREVAARYYGRLRFVWSDADPALRWLARVKGLGLSAEPHDESPGPQRDYRSVTLNHLGPARWEPYVAPELEAVDAAGEGVSLVDYRGQSVLLVFYLGEECLHCVEQLVAIQERHREFATERVALLAISSATPEENAKSAQLGDLSFRLLSDDAEHTNARRFQSYDDFEEMELHSTILIDGEGRVRWARTGGDPFMDLDFVLAEIRRVNGREGSG